MRGPRRRAHRLAAVLVLALATAVAAGCARREPGSPDAPRGPLDLLLITVDTFRADRAGCFGNPEGITPSLDRALRAGWLARNAYAPAPLTAISHATLLTALEPYHHGVRENGLYSLDPSVPTLAAHLAGRGFLTAGFIAAFPLESRFGFGSGFGTFDEDLGPESSDGMSYAERPARAVVDSALAWLSARARRERVFVWAHFFDPHHPHSPPAPYRSLPGIGDYEREIRAMDAQIGRLLRGVERLGRAPVLAIASDHGEGLGDHGEMSHGILLHEETMRGLLGVAVPATSPASGRLRGIHEPVVRFADLAPTVLDVLDAEPMDGIDGVSVLAGVPPDGVYGETYYPMLHYRWSPLLSWRDDRWALVEGPNPELYDRVADPGETRNVASEHPEVARALRARLAEVTRPPEAPVTSLDAEAREKLAALGYVSAPAAAGHDASKDPKLLIGAVNDLFRGITLVREGRAREALAFLQRAYRADPGSPTHVYQLANCLRLVGETEAAMAYYRRALEMDPRAAEAWAHLAVLHFERGDREEAFRLLDEGIRGNPDAFSLRMTAGDLEAERGRAHAARAHYERAAELSPRRAEPREALARLAGGPR